MNNERRKELARAFELVEEALTIVQTVKDAEQEAVDNLSDRFPGSERVEKMEETVSSLEEADDALEQALVGIEAARE